MLIGDPFYLLLLIPVVAGFWLLRAGQPRLMFLLLVSYGYYCTFRALFLLVLLAVTGLAYCGAIAIAQAETGRSRSWRLLAVLTLILLPLVIFKYVAPLLSSTQFIGARWQLDLTQLTSPVGLSFFTFMAIGYVVDVYLGVLQPERGLSRVGLLTAFFPHVTAGPIARATGFLPQIAFNRPFGADAAMRGVREILIGVAMKLWIADSLAGPVNLVYANPENYVPLEKFLATVFFAFQIYADFAGYSLIAIGSARLFGVELADNFRQPYLSRSIPEFWRSWHITLFTWLRDYVFMPLRLRWRHYPAMGSHAAIFITLLLVGVWHGAGWGFVVFGAVHGALMIASAVTLGRRDALWRVVKAPVWLVTAVKIAVTFLIIVLTMVLFRARDLSQALEIYCGIFSSEMARNLANNLALVPYDPKLGVLRELTWSQQSTNYLLILVVLTGDMVARSRLNLDRVPGFAQAALYAVCVLVVLHQVIGYNATKPFIYFQF